MKKDQKDEDLKGKRFDFVEAELTILQMHTAPAMRFLRQAEQRALNQVAHLAVRRCKLPEDCRVAIVRSPAGEAIGMEIVEPHAKPAAEAPAKPPTPAPSPEPKKRTKGGRGRRKR